MPHMLKINEIFHSIQGESTWAGRPCVFVRLTGCHLRCVWCDTEYAFHDGRPMELEAVLEQVAAFGCDLVEVTGGEPLLQPECIPLLRSLLDRGYTVLLETSGALPIDEVPVGVHRIVDVKCPDSGESARNRWENLTVLRPGDELKFVIAGRGDYDWAKQQLERRGPFEDVPVLFSAAEPSLQAGELSDWVLEDRLAVRVQLQMHKILWPEATRGY